MTLRIKDWAEFQHYKHRQPPWIRLYGKLLDDPEWFSLQGRASWVLASCWLIAREDEEQQGSLPSIAKLAFRLRIGVEELSSYIRQLTHWLTFDASDLLADCKQLATPETETETETEEDTADAVSAEGTFLRVGEPLPLEVPVDGPLVIEITASSEVPAEGKSGKYVFEDGVIRLTESDFKKWSEAFSHVNLRSALLGMSAWAADQGNWFHAVKGALAKKDQQALAAIESAKAEAVVNGEKIVRHSPKDKWAGIV